MTPFGLNRLITDLPCRKHCLRKECTLTFVSGALPAAPSGKSPKRRSLCYGANQPMGDFFISAQELSLRLAKAEPLRVFDVRRPAAIEPQSRFLPGSRWRNHLEVVEWAQSMRRDSLLVVNCMHGHNVSQISAALLREAGYNARALQGGRRWLDRRWFADCRSKPSLPFSCTAERLGDPHQSED